MKKILITESKGNIGNQIVLELFKEKYDITLLTSNLNQSFKELPLPVKRIEFDLLSGTMPKEKVEDIDIVINLSLLERLPTDIDIKGARNLVDSFGSGTKFIHFSSSDIYAESVSSSFEDGKLGDSISQRRYLQVENLFSQVRSSVVRTGVIVSSHNKELSSLVSRSRFFFGKVFFKQTEFSWIHFDDVISNLISFINAEDIESILNISAGTSSSKSLSDFISILTQRKHFIPSLSKSMGLLHSSNLMGTHYKSRIVVKKTDLLSALLETFSYLKSPTLKSEYFHYEYNKVQFIKKDIQTVFDFFKDANNLGEITPKKLKFTITSQSTPEIQEGTVFTYKLQLNKIPFSWTTHIENWDAPNIFTDYQQKGPYQVWYHTHSFYELDQGTLMIDNVKYRLPLGFIGDLFGLAFVKNNIKDIFNYRFKVIEDILK